MTDLQTTLNRAAGIHFNKKPKQKKKTLKQTLFNVQLSMVHAAHTHLLHHYCSQISAANTLFAGATYLAAILLALKIF